MKRIVLSVVLALGTLLVKAQGDCIKIDEPSVKVNPISGNPKTVTFNYSNAQHKSGTIEIQVNGVTVTSSAFDYHTSNNSGTRSFTSGTFTANDVTKIDIVINSESWSWFWFFWYKNGKTCTTTYHPFNESPLPVTFGDFTAVRHSSSVSLKWETFTESNNTGFNVERYNNASATWESVAFIPSQASNGNSNGKLTYQFTDQNNSNAISQYRIKQTDFDGKFSYSKVCAVQGQNQMARTVVFPNPSSNGRVTVSYPDASLRNIMLVDMSGRMVRQWRSYSNSSLQIDNLTPGMYSLRTIGTNNESSVEKILVAGNN